MARRMCIRCKEETNRLYQFQLKMYPCCEKCTQKIEGTILEMLKGEKK